MFPEQVALHTSPGRAIHLQKNVRLERFYEVVDVGVGTARFADAADAAAFFSYLKGDSPVAKTATDVVPIPTIAAIPGVHIYYDYGRWHLSLRSRAEEDRVLSFHAGGMFATDTPYEPYNFWLSKTEQERRGLTLWTESIGYKNIFPSTPPRSHYMDNLNHWGTTEFLPYGEATLALDLNLVEAIDAEKPPFPGVRSVRLRGGTTLFVRRSTPLGTARAADGSWRLWLGDGAGWRPASGSNSDMWMAVAPVCFGTPIDELVELIPFAKPAGEIWSVLTGDDDTLEPLPFPTDEAISPDAEYITVLSFDGTVVIGGEEILGEADLCGADRWTIYMKETP